MPGLSHIFLHVVFCSAIAHTPLGTTTPMHVQMVHHNGAIEFDKVYNVTHNGPDTVVEFDIQDGVYRLQIVTPKYPCSRTDFLDVLPELNRNVSEKLDDGPPLPPLPVFLLEGTAPVSFQYLRPTFVLFDKSLACNQPVTTPLAVRNTVEYDQGAFHVWLYTDPATEAMTPVLALRLTTPTSTAHYIRIRFPFPQPWGGWPNNYRLNISEEMVDSLATEKVDTLLCPKIWQTSVPG
ncbi:MAG TPA: hypothetical protein VKG44_07295 [Candidatus Baltobacteraceae bacterium]|nr:hypothetical protein [Candidatus Baltobacteraceae bacterium]